MSGLYIDFVSASLHSLLISYRALIDGSLFKIEFMQKLEKFSAKLCSGIWIMPLSGGFGGGFSGGSTNGPEINLGPFFLRCLSNTILFRVLAKSKLTSLRRVVASEELLPLSR